MPEHVFNHDEPLTWTAHPAREQLSLGLAGLVVVGLLAWGGAMLAGHWLWGVVIALAMIVSLQEFFLPSTYRIDAEGITAASAFRRKRYAWSSVKRFGHDAGGGFLSKRARASIRDRYVGMHLQWPDKPQQREAVVAAIRERLNQSEAAAVLLPDAGVA